MKNSYFIKNRKGKKIAVTADLVSDQKGLAFVIHGLGGFKQQPQIQTIAAAFKDNGYSVVLFDSTNSIGESDGKLEDATVQGYYEDLEDVISWSATQPWYQEPFCLSGHSLGGYGSFLFATRNPEKVLAIAPIQPFISGQLSFESTPKNELEDWQRTGWQIKESRSRPGLIKKLPWSHMQVRLNHDLLKEDLDKLKMPILIVAGDLDQSTPAEQQRILYDRLPDKKELFVVKGAPHGFFSQEHLDELYKILDHWIKNKL